MANPLDLNIDSLISEMNHWFATVDYKKLMDAKIAELGCDEYWFCWWLSYA